MAKKQVKQPEEVKNNSIGLDNLFSDKQPMSATKGDIMDLVIAPKVKKQAIQAKVETSAAAICDQFAVKLYMVDSSSSMMDSCVEINDIQYDWPEDKDLKSYLHNVLSHTYGRSKEVLAFRDIIDETPNAELKMAMIDMGPREFGIYPKRDPVSTKMSLVKKCIAGLVDRRYEKLPDARIALGSFTTNALIEASDHNNIKLRLQELQAGGGTDIINAVNEALIYFEKYPSAVNVHQLILVTDGEDWSAVKIVDMIPRMLDLGVTLDYIYIKNRQAATEGASSVANAFTKACKETGGEYVEVDSPSAFEKKLLVASTRLCLPSGM
jgi:hypothetical protein